MHQAVHLQKQKGTMKQSPRSTVALLHIMIILHMCLVATAMNGIGTMLPAV